MKKFLEQKKSAIVSGMNNNKGFSLVELIIVVAIMAVLMGVLAPQYLRFVESSRQQTDLTAANEILKVTRIGIATLSSTPDGATITWDTTTGSPNGVKVAGSATTALETALQNEIDATLGTDGSTVGGASSSWIQGLGTIVFNIAQDNGVPYIWCGEEQIAYDLKIPSMDDPNAIPTVDPDNRG